MEKYLLTAADLQRALALWPAAGALVRQSLGAVPAIHPGFQRLVRMVVGLPHLIGDALTPPQLDVRIDVWFLDGFARTRIRYTWTPPPLQELARLSAPGASLATFTSKGTVRRDRSGAGFADAPRARLRQEAGNPAGV